MCIKTTSRIDRSQTEMPSDYVYYNHSANFCLDKNTISTTLQLNYRLGAQCSKVHKDQFEHRPIIPYNPKVWASLFLQVQPYNPKSFFGKA